MIWWPKKIDETNRFMVKSWKGFDLTILKAKQIHYKRIEVFIIRFNSKSIATPVVTYWHDHVQASNLRTPSLLGFTPTQAASLVTLRSHSKVSATQTL